MTRRLDHDAAIGLRIGLMAIATLALIPAPLFAAPAFPAAIHARALPFDPHLDIDTTFDSPTTPASADGPTQFDLPKVARGGLKAAGLAVFVPQETETPDYLARARAIAEAKHRIITGLAARYPDKVEIALSAADVRRIAAKSRLAIVETVVNGGAFIDTLDDLDLWQKRGIRIFGFVHAGHNRLADSSRPALTRGETASAMAGFRRLAGRRSAASTGWAY